MKFAIIPFLILLLFGCLQEPKIALSNNTNELKKYVNIEKYKPTKSEWKYIQMGDQSDRIPGPNDYKLNAVLYFQPKIIKSIKDDYDLLSVSLESYQKDSFKFDWLEQKTISEIEKGDFVFYNSSFFEKGTLANGGFIIINDSTLLLILGTL